jgi:surface polysaccharide O-acyltransferase-like enzyme
MTGMSLFFKGDIIQKNISQYYYTGMRDVLTGALCAIALFMFYYRGYDKWDNRIGNLAGILCLGIAWFPTTPTEPQNLIGSIHLICASGFFIILSGFSLFRFTLTEQGKSRTKQKLNRNIIYNICGVVMLVSLVSILVFFKFFFDEGSGSHFVFWGETIALIAFGVSWLTKGGTLYPDKRKGI